MPVVVRDRQLLIRPVQSETYLRLSSGWNCDLVPPRRLGAALVRIHRGGTSDHMVVDPILGVLSDRIGSEQPGVIGFVLTEQRLRAGAIGSWGGIKSIAGQAWMINDDAIVV
jgi:hypothetical protein